MAQSVQLHWRWNKANLSRDSLWVLPVSHLGLVHIEILASSIAAPVQNPTVDMIFTGLRLGYVALVQIVLPPLVRKPISVPVQLGWAWDAEHLASP